jgi:hypothetical protein
MPSQKDRGPRNAFTGNFLARLDELVEPDGAREADLAGPWVIRPVPYRGGTGFALLREWESMKDSDDGGGASDSGGDRHGASDSGGDLPYAVFRRRETALLAAAVLPATGREPLFRLDTEPDARGFPLHACGAPWPRQDRRRLEGEGDGVGATPATSTASPGPAEGPNLAAAAGASQTNVVGHLRDFDEGLADALRVAAALVRSPIALARLLEAAGYVALEQAGRILDRQIPHSMR